MTVIDIHTHMLSRDYLDRLVKFSNGVYSVGSDVAQNEAVIKDGTPFVTLTPEMFDYDKRIADMDATGIDVSVVSLTAPSAYWGGREVSIETSVSMNESMAAAQAQYPTRLRFFATLPWQYPDAAVAELHRAKDRGAVGVLVLANIEGQSLTDPLFAPIWKAIDDLALPVLVHPTTPPGLQELDMASYHLVWSLGFTFDTSLAVSRMLMDGFFDRYKGLKIIASHGGGTLPFLLPRLDQGFRSFESTRVAISKLPSEYLDQIYVDSIVYSEAALAYTVEVFGEKNVLFGTDYPHRCSDVSQMLELSGTLPASTRRLVEASNAERIFNL
jgi:aminocarboxymuconate-semialdehyde decarboxylase